MALAVALSLSAAACQDRPVTGTDGGAMSAVFDSFVDDLARAVCGWQVRCCSLPEMDAIGRSGYLNETECRSWMGSSLRERLSELRFALVDGRVSFAPAAAASCLAEFTRSSCDTADEDRSGSDGVIWERIAACLLPVVGTQPEGEVCFIPAECGPGTSCRSGVDLTSGSQDTLGGIRAAPNFRSSFFGSRGHCDRDKGEAEPCSATSQCMPGLYCRRTDFVCARPAGEGQSCGAVRDEGGVVTSTVVACSEGPTPLLCVGGRCRRYPRAGEPCLPQGASRLLCGVAPDPDLTCVGSGFNGTGTCAKKGTVGAVCAGSDGLPACADALACADSEFGVGSCQPPPAAGHLCGVDGRCSPPAVCYGTFNMCVVPRAARAGARCANDLDCASLRCVPELAAPTEVGGPTGICANQVDSTICSGAGHFTAAGSMIPDVVPMDARGARPPSSDGAAPSADGAVDGGAIRF